MFVDMSVAHLMDPQSNELTLGGSPNKKTIASPADGLEEESRNSSLDKLGSESINGLIPSMEKSVELKGLKLKLTKKEIKQRLAAQKKT
mmetsp:Transcript_16480/g.25444  ORF Transcript_16480/g.25444 Transcript_16480/m.25444 type:complete len:89 (-) Transcript_16480:285-551(-)